MSIPPPIIVNADDIGLKPSVNKAILYSFEQGYINSTSLLTNTDFFNDTIDLIHQNPTIKNIGLHVNFAKGRPVTNFTQKQFLDAEGNWDINKTGKLISVLNNETKAAFLKEIDAQLERALTANIKIVHIDSHLHLHTLPAFYNLFIEIAKKRGLKLRLAQTYREGSYLKFFYRKYINNKIQVSDINYSKYFVTVEEFLKNNTNFSEVDKIEIMVHPDFDNTGKLFDHVDIKSMDNWISYLNGSFVLLLFVAKLCLC
ncbi:MAG: ChbG/HpnK family deacetylase [Mucilaginibacter sp.]|nr:ChbG/HpnK family deacetylase [Mucilaginibacter sp.]